MRAATGWTGRINWYSRLSPETSSVTVVVVVPAAAAGGADGVGSGAAGGAVRPSRDERLVLAWTVRTTGTRIGCPVTYPATRPAATATTAVAVQRRAAVRTALHPTTTRTSRFDWHPGSVDSRQCFPAAEKVKGSRIATGSVAVTWGVWTLVPLVR